MIRGTTPLLKFILPFNVSIIQLVYITFSQKGNEVFTLETSNCTLSESIISAKLTQQQTLLFKHNTPVEIQIRILTKDEDALVSNIIRTTVEKILKDGEI